MESLILLNVLLLALLMIAYLIFNREILSPSVICVCMYFLSAFIMLFYCNEWGVDLSLSTIALIVIALLGVLLGELVGSKIRVIDFNVKPKKEISIIWLSKSNSVFCLMFMLITAVLYYRELITIAANSAYANSVYGQAYSFLMQVKYAKILEDANVAYYVQQMYTCCEAVACVLVYILLHNKILYGKMRGNLYAYLTIVIYIATSFMTTGRAMMLNFFIYILCIWLVLIAKKKEWVFNNNIKLFGKGLAIIGVAISLFYLAGFLTEKSLRYDNFFDNFANYFSSSLYALDQYMKNPATFRGESDFFGIHTLSGIYSLLRTLGIKIPSSIVALEYIQCGKYLTNIYTPLRRYLQDFSWGGVFLIMFLVGYGYKRLIWLNKKQQCSPIYCIFTAYFIFPLFFISIEERIFMDIVMARSIYTFFYLIFIYQWLVNNRFFRKQIRLGIRKR